MKKLLSRILALLLVLLLIVNISPIRARAMMPVVGWDGFAWNLSEIIASGAIGIGTSPGAVPDDWNNMIENAKQACQDFFGLVGDTMKIYRFFDGSSYKYYAKADFVEWLRGWMFSESYVSIADAYIPLSSGRFLDMGNEWNYGFGSDGSGFGVKWYHGKWNDDGTYSCCPHWALISTSPFTEVCQYGSDGSLRGTATGSSPSLVVDGTTYYYRGNESHEWYTYPNKNSSYFIGAFDSTELTKSLYGIVKYAVSGGLILGVESEYDFSLGKIESPDKLFGDAYPEWVQNSVYIPAEVAGTEEEVLALPLGLGQTLDETQGLNQEQIWAGESTLEVEIEEALEGTVAGTSWATFTQWVSQTWATFTVELIAIKDAILGLPQTIADFFTPSGEITMYSLDLTDLFPFCIPFDLFDLLSALKADPVAPVFELEMDFGVTKAPIVIDLSGWSDLASIIRILEVGLFCLGLALGTKELIGS